MSGVGECAIGPGLIADARRALWLPEHRCVAASDLHLGYAWAHRTAGNLMPVVQGEPTGDDLLALVHERRAERVVLVGDVVHGTVGAPEWADGFRRWFDALCALAEVVWVEGNHDRASRMRLPGERVAEFRLGRFVFSHGDLPARDRGGTLILGHHHPAVVLGDGIASRVRCPCFVVGPGWVVLPAFSPWAAGGTEPGASPNGLAPESARIAIVGERLLAIPSGGDGSRPGFRRRPAR